MVAPRPEDGMVELAEVVERLIDAVETLATVSQMWSGVDMSPVLSKISGLAERARSARNLLNSFYESLGELHVAGRPWFTRVFQPFII